MRKMTFEEAVDFCWVRGYIARDANPNKKYWKNTLRPFADVSLEDRKEDDWRAYDPEGESTSIVG